MTGPAPSGPARAGSNGDEAHGARAPGDRAPTVFFLSDYGLRDGFVGVVHAVLRRLVPGAVVVDLTHEVPPFDVRAGAEALLRAVPHLGSGVVLGVVDPGVGGDRRGVAVEAAGDPDRSLVFVGPDNGLLVPAAEGAGLIGAVAELPQDPEAPATFDGRDVFAPAVAALCEGTPVGDLGPALAPEELVRVPAPVCEVRRSGDGGRVIRAEVTWVDRFGNVQLAVPGDAVPGSVPALTVAPEPAGAGPGAGTATFGPGSSAVSWVIPEPVTRVRTFADLASGEVGILVDANGRLALVVREGSAALRLGVGTGDLLTLTW